ncbi:chitinase 18-4 [Metarhizium brunneum]
MGQSIGSLFPLRWRLWLGNLLFPPLGPSTYRVSWHRVIKGPCDPTEIEAMNYVAAHTTVPVPKIYAVHNEGHFTYIEMEFIRGETLEEAWEHLSKGQMTAIFDDLKNHLSSLRALQPPKQGMVSSALQNPAFDCRIGFRFFGPVSHDDFHSLTRGHLIMEDVEPFLGPEVAKTHTGSYATYFTHADLAPRNIMVRNGRIIAIIDWAFAGWYPEYWEFTKVHYNLFFGQDVWVEYMRLMLPGYETELAAERILWRRLPEPGTISGTFSNPHVHTKGSTPSAEWLRKRAGLKSKDLWSLALARGKYDTTVVA